MNMAPGTTNHLNHTLPINQSLATPASAVVATSSPSHTTNARCLDITLVKQRHEWDCGLACIEMIQKWHLNNKQQQQQHNATSLNPTTETITSSSDCASIARNIITTQSVWSIDLSDALATMGINHHFFTVSIGIDNSHRLKPFYQRDWSADEQRVSRLFDKSRAHDPPMLFFGVVPLEKLIAHVKQGLPAIVLVDSNSLVYIVNNNNDGNSSNTSSGSSNSSSSSGHKREDKDFYGHFVVLAGYDDSRQQFIVIDPSLSQEYCMISVNDFEYARSRPGTDMDILLIH
ncbi:hypothetical protein SAMD00019534_020680 [Acytostelium subglobosum LB1]|uniref:hypothetical protein n=1 Tax=Acytostelium subglobosum LB1 TaxID=1410327 RepID=UPI00064508E3|nr:hypothetical protein SAMD00019534_020680 [Acytostelium subglobosum LB1]GAM18893.1 hypothetical protein SAMD00019534_020680 [Acytostelium subglobosum LB1]|eukprot:XP_012758113.1 hypothetical protein SAMD00019534_020680 [Acytostelium subglobosum LB1]